MTLSKRDFLKIGAGAVAGAAVLGATTNSAHAEAPALERITGDVKAITVEERQSRVAKAQKLMAEHGLGAILLEPGPAMLYFTGISWWRSERLTAVVIPASGDIAVVTPFFEEPSVRESMTFGDDVRTWHEHESPFERVAGILKDRGLAGGKIGFEDTVRYFVVEGMKAAAPGFEIASALPVTLGCRMYKSAHEIALMKKSQ